MCSKVKFQLLFPCYIVTHCELCDFKVHIIPTYLPLNILLLLLLNIVLYCYLISCYIAFQYRVVLLLNIVLYRFEIMLRLSGSYWAGHGPTRCLAHLSPTQLSPKYIWAGQDPTQFFIQPILISSISTQPAHLTPLIRIIQRRYK